MRGLRRLLGFICHAANLLLLLRPLCIPRLLRPVRVVFWLLNGCWCFPVLVKSMDPEARGSGLESCPYHWLRLVSLWSAFWDCTGSLLGLVLRNNTSREVKKVGLGREKWEYETIAIGTSVDSTRYLELGETLELPYLYPTSNRVGCLWPRVWPLVRWLLLAKSKSKLSQNAYHLGKHLSSGGEIRAIQHSILICSALWLVTVGFSSSSEPASFNS